ncbi:hypothetical protein [Clostridium sp. CF012]|uniref:XkdQ/YqbQ family protein n=1 Tax=Clostridium sp. CF012 TaxID=2843319 RepID=UPI001C0E41AA|nr:hypothetical protein [Clostridium sp. CF012]MBU3145028.1 hypothetical protein [Clostridium sp. CF012]
MKYELIALVGGKWINILLKSNGINWSSDKDTLGIQLSFASLFDLVEGTHIQLKINSKVAFTGILVKKTKSKLTYSYTCFDYGWYLNKNETVIQFNKINSSDAIKQLCSKFGIKCNVVQIDYVVKDTKTKSVKKVKITTIINKIYKDQTISSIIDDILETATLELGTKFIKEMIGDTLYIRKQAEYKIFPKFILSSDLQVNSSIEDMKNKVIVVSNEEKSNRVLASVSSPNNIKIYGGLQEVLTVEKKDESKAKNIANNFLKENNKVFRDTTLNIVVIEGGEEIKANRSIGLKIISMGLNGWYNIKGANCTLENGQMKCSLTLEW